jgi:hypothetical protein
VTASEAVGHERYGIRTPAAALFTHPLRCRRTVDIEMIDLLMLAITVGLFGLLFALARWIDLI